MTKQQKNFLLITILLISILQMPGQATAPAINKIYTDVFNDKPLSVIQTAFSITSIAAALGSIPPAILIRRGIISKRAAVATGMFLFGTAALLISLMHTHFWQLVIVAAIVGIGAASFISPMISVMVDNFQGEEGKRAAGLQSTFNGIGGITLSILGGYLVNFRWFGGYLLLLAGFPVGVLVLLSFPKGKLPRVRHNENAPIKRTKLPSDVYYYTLFALLAMFLFIVGSNNISVHLSRSGIKNYTAAAGYATAFQMAGTAIAGALFKKLTSKLDDMMMPLAFIMVFIGDTIINLFDHSLPMMYLGIMLAGSTIGIMTPQCIHSVSKLVDETNSATATAFLNAVAPGVGAFLSPIVMTNVTLALGGDSTNFRFQFAAFVGLGLAIILVFLTKFREKRRSARAA